MRRRTATSPFFPYTTLFRSAISGSSAVRQSMHVSGSDKTLAKVTVRVERASGVGDLTLRVQDAAGTTLDSCNVPASARSEEHTSELQSLRHLVCRLLLEKKK